MSNEELADELEHIATMSRAFVQADRNTMRRCAEALRQSATVRALAMEEAAKAVEDSGGDNAEWHAGKVRALSPAPDLEAMVELGATALFREKFALDDTTCLAASATINDVGEPYRSGYIKAARAVLAAVGFK